MNSKQKEEVKIVQLAHYGIMGDSGVFKFRLNCKPTAHWIALFDNLVNRMIEAEIEEENTFDFNPIISLTVDDLQSATLQFAYDDLVKSVELTNDHYNNPEEPDDPEPNRKEHEKAVADFVLNNFGPQKK